MTWLKLLGLYLEFSTLAALYAGAFIAPPRGRRPTAAEDKPCPLPPSVCRSSFFE
jgi:hypothetical protein